MIQMIRLLGTLAVGAVQADPYVELAGLIVSEVRETHSSAEAELLLDLDPFDGVDASAHATRTRAVAEAAGLSARTFRSVLGCDRRVNPLACRFENSNQYLLRLGKLEIDGNQATFGIVIYTPGGPYGHYFGNSTAVFERNRSGDWTLKEWIRGATT